MQLHLFFKSLLCVAALLGCQQSLSMVISGGPLRPENEHFAVALAKELGLDPNVTFERTCISAQEMYPMWAYETVHQAADHKAYIPQEWFDKLTSAEKRIMLGRGLLHIKEPNKAVQFEQATQHSLAITGVAMLATAGAGYYLLGKKEITGDYVMPAWAKFCGAWLATGLISAAIIAPLHTKYLSDRVYDWANKLIKELGNDKQAALSYYIKLEKELAPQAHTATWKMYYKFVQAIRKRLASE